jgi:threonylcarbamoyladenosine tRNA methylthiotransferase MtaB
LWRLIAEEPRLMPHLHLSVQAGNDLILKRMKRRHSRAGALATVRRAQELRPGIAIGADLIAGFPTETDAMFEDTLALVAETGLPFVHVFPYSERPDTPAARMPSVPQTVRRERAAKLRALGGENLDRFLRAQIGRSVDILAETATTGLTEHFARANFSFDSRPGEVVAARVYGVADGVLLTERV